MFMQMRRAYRRRYGLNPPSTSDPSPDGYQWQSMKSVPANFPLELRYKDGRTVRTDREGYYDYATSTHASDYMWRYAAPMTGIEREELGWPEL